MPSDHCDTRSKDVWLKLKSFFHRPTDSFFFFFFFLKKTDMGNSFQEVCIFLGGTIRS